MHILDMCKAIGSSDDLGRAMFLDDLARHSRREVPLKRIDATLVGYVGDVGRLNPENAMTAFLKVRNQRTIIGADVDYKIGLSEAEHFRRLCVQFRKVVPQNTSHARSEEHTSELQ